MNNFEYLQYVSVGQYLATGSPIHRLDPRARILGSLFLLTAITLATRPISMLLALALVLVLIGIARIPFSFLVKSLLPPLPFLLILAVLQILFLTSPGTTTVLYQAGWIRVSMASLLSAGILLLRFASLILLISLASLCISTSEMILGLDALLAPLARLHLPTGDLVMMVQVMLHFLPFLALSAERIAKAQASRGAVWGTRAGGLFGRVRQVVPLLIPLFLYALRKSENLALAMEARGYGGPTRRSSMTELRFLPRDALAAAASLLLALLVLLVK